VPSDVILMHHMPAIDSETSGKVNKGWEASKIHLAVIPDSILCGGLFQATLDFCKRTELFDPTYNGGDCAKMLG